MQMTIMSILTLPSLPTYKLIAWAIMDNCTPLLIYYFSCQVEMV